MQGQANHFVASAPVKLDYPIKRYVDETLRLYAVLEHGLEGKQWLAGEYNIADIGNYCCIAASFFVGGAAISHPACVGLGATIPPARRPTLQHTSLPHCVRPAPLSKQATQPVQAQ